MNVGTWGQPKSLKLMLKAVLSISSVFSPPWSHKINHTFPFLVIGTTSCCQWRGTSKKSAGKFPSLSLPPTPAPLSPLSILTACSTNVTISNSYMSHAQGINNCQVYISKPAFIGSMFILISWTWSHSNFLFSPTAWKIDSEKMHTQWGLDRRDQRCDLWDEVHLLRGFLLHGFKQLYQSIWHTSPHTWPYDLFCIWWAHPVMQ